LKNIHTKEKNKFSLPHFLKEKGRCTKSIKWKKGKPSSSQLLLQDPGAGRDVENKIK
jgi:hypothetical protein